MQKISLLKFITHRRLNNVLSCLIILAALYIMVSPYIPELRFRIQKSHKAAAPYSGVLSSGVQSNVSEPPKPIPKDNRIVIPSAFIDQPIIEGNGLWVVDNGGAWRKNLWIEDPKQSGNTIIVGHRFTYANPEGAFYHLDKVEVGDKLALYWQGEELIYVVTEKKVVPATAVEVEQDTPDRTLTLYTCTPLITAENRLVIIAKPLQKDEHEK